MPPKRKRGIATPINSRESTPRKRAKTPASPERRGDVYFPIGILDERRINNRVQYLLDWQPDAETGHLYDPSWEPIRNVGQGLIDDWEKEKAKARRRTSVAGSPIAEKAASPIKSSPVESPTAVPARQKLKLKLRRVVESDDSSPPAYNSQPTSTQDDYHEVAETQQPGSTRAFVEIPQPTPSYYRGDYVVVPSSQIQYSSAPPETLENSTQSEYLPTQVAGGDSTTTASNGISTQEDTQGTTSQNAQSSIANVSEETSGLFVPDSQSGHEETSVAVQDHAAATQDTSTTHADLLAPTQQPNSTPGEPDHATQNSLRDTSSHQSAPEHRESLPLENRPNLTLQTDYSFPPIAPVELHSENLPPTSFQRPVELIESSGSTSFPLTQPQQTNVEDNTATAQAGGTARSTATSQPAGLSSPFEATPSLVLVPSQPFYIGESAPSRPDTLPSIETMERDRQSPGGPPRATTTDVSPRSSNLGEQLKAIRDAKQQKLRALREERARRESTAHSISNETPISPVVANPAIALSMSQDSPASPAAIPAVEPQPVITQEEMNTSERYGTLVPDTHNVEEEAPQAKIASVTAPDEIQRHEDGIHLVPIIMTGHQRDQYPQEVIFNERAITSFLESRDPDEKTTQTAVHVAQKLRSIAIHPDLINLDTLTPPDKYDAEFGPRALVQWDKDASSKFRFINELYEQLKSTNLDIAVMCPNAVTADKLKTFLANIGAPTHVPGEALSQQSLNFVIINAQGDVVVTSPVDLVIGIDHTLTHEQMSCRGLLRQDGRLTRPIALVVPKTIEHIELSLSKKLPQHTYLRVLLGAVRRYCREAGKTADPNATVSGVAAALTRFLTSDQEGEWGVPSLTVLHDLDSQTQTETSDENDRSKTGKRALEEPEEIGTKRVRLETPQAQEPGTSRVSDSAAMSSSNIASSGSADVQHLQRALQKANESGTKAEEQVSELTAAIEGLQYRYEEQRQTIVKLTKERDEAISTATRATAQLNKFKDSGAARRTELESVREQLLEAQTALATHAVPERAELETMRAAWRAETAARQKAEARLKSVEGERDYAQEGYQTASTQATEFLQQSRELEDQVSDWRRRASAEPARLRQMQLDGHAVILQKENKRLKAQLKERETTLKMRDDEMTKMKEASRGRMGTRGNSMPRSPRMGSPLKLATDGRGRHSRAGSPIKAGNGAQHPLRNEQ